MKNESNKIHTIATSIAPTNIENQRQAIESWMKLGFKVVSLNSPDEMTILKEQFTNIEFIAVKRDARTQYGKPYVYFDDVLEYFRNHDSSGICGIVNSDIHLIGSTMYELISREAQGSFVFGARLDVENLENLTGEVFNGFDYFFFDCQFASCYPKSIFCLGQPWWDAWAPFIPISKGLPVKLLTGQFAYHIKHERQYSTQAWIALGLHFFSHIQCLIEPLPENVGKLEGYVRYITHRQAQLVRVEGNHEPVLEQGQMAMVASSDNYSLLAGELEWYFQYCLTRQRLNWRDMTVVVGDTFKRYGFHQNLASKAEEIHNILVIRLDEIGDVVLNSPLLRELRQQFPTANITLVVKPQVYNLVELCPYVNNVLVFDWQAYKRSNNSILAFMNIIKLCQHELWDKKFDLCILPRYDHDMYLSTVLSYLSGAKMRMGYTETATPTKKRVNVGYDIMLTHALPGSGIKHEVERNLDIVRQFGKVNEVGLEVWTGAEDDALAARELGEGKQLKVAFSPGRQHRRAWPIERYLQLADWLHKKYDAIIILLGAPEEQEMAKKLAELLPKVVIDFTGRTTLRQMASLLKQCDVYVGRDTGVMHIAAAAGTKIIEISCHPVVGDGNHENSPRRFGPWGVPSVVLQPPKPLSPCQTGCHQSKAHCILQVTVEQVQLGIDKMLSNEAHMSASPIVVPRGNDFGGNNMRILFIHPNFPAQFLNLAPALGKNPDNQVVFLTNRREGSLPGVQKVYYDKAREVASQTHNYVRPLEDAVLQGQAACRTAIQLKQQGFIPDAIYAHSGWGPGMFMKEIFPQAAVINYFEWFYHSHGSDADFDSAEPLSLDGECRIRAKNAPILIDACSCDRGVSPTYYQRSQFPPELQAKINVLHDGVNSEFYQPKADAKLILPNSNLDLSEVEEIVTYVGRGMEPYRGFPQFMEAVEILLKRRPNCHVVIVGADRVAYGKALPDGKTYKQLMLEKLDIDLMRVHFTGLLPYHQYRQVLQASSAHVYLTRPFVLSWSMLEAMSTGCLLVASDTAPVKEVITDGENGLLVDFFSPPQIAARIEEALTNPERMAVIRQNARQTILDNYALEKLLPQQMALLEEIVREKRS